MSRGTKLLYGAVKRAARAANAARDPSQIVRQAQQKIEDGYRRYQQENPADQSLQPQATRFPFTQKRSLSTSAASFAKKVPPLSELERIGISQDLMDPTRDIHASTNSRKKELPPKIKIPKEPVISLPNQLREAVKTNNVPYLKALIVSTEFPTYANMPFIKGKTLMQYAISLGEREEVVKALKESQYVLMDATSRKGKTVFDYAETARIRAYEPLGSAPDLSFLPKEVIDKYSEIVAIKELLTEEEVDDLVQDLKNLSDRIGKWKSTSDIVLKDLIPEKLIEKLNKTSKKIEEYSKNMGGELIETGMGFEENPDTKVSKAIKEDIKAMIGIINNNISSKFDDELKAKIKNSINNIKLKFGISFDYSSVIDTEPKTIDPDAKEISVRPDIMDPRPKSSQPFDPSKIQKKDLHTSAPRLDESKKTHEGNVLHIIASSSKGPNALETLVKQASELVKEFINQQDEDRNTPLHIAASAEVDRVRLVELLLENGANPSIKNDLGQTAADIAQDKGNLGVHAQLTIATNSKQQVASKPFDPNQKRGLHTSAYSQAPVRNQPYYTKRDMQEIADSMTPALILGYIESGQSELLAQLAREYDFDINMPNKDERTALDLLKRGADKDKYDETIKTLRGLGGRTSAELLALENHGPSTHPSSPASSRNGGNRER